MDQVSADLSAVMDNLGLNDRAAAFINSATIWKWRKGAVHLRKWNLFAVAGKIRRRVYVMNGSHDRFHRADLFPGVARAIPDGIFIRVPVGESRRERFMGVTATLFAESDANGDLPSSLRGFVGPTDQDDAGHLCQFDTA